MTTVATGGFSTRDGSIASFGSAAIDYIAVTFMILGALPFLIYVKMVRGNISSLWRDSQVRAFVLILALVTLVAIVVQYMDEIARGEVALRHAIFFCDVGDDRHGLRHNRLWIVGRHFGDAVFHHHLYWRLRRVHFLRYQNFPVSGAVLGFKTAYPTNSLSLWRVCETL